MRLIRLALLAVLLAMAVVATGSPAATGAVAKPDCKSGYEPVRQKGVWKCKRKGWDAVTPSRIEIVVGKLRDEQFGATGYFEFAKKVTGSVYGHWIISNGLGHQRVSFTLRHLKDTNYIPFTTTKRRVGLTGETLTAVLVVGKVRSSPVTLIQ